MQRSDNLVDAITGTALPASVVQGIINRNARSVPGYTGVQVLCRLRVCDMQFNPLSVMPAAPPGWDTAKQLPWDRSDLAVLVPPTSAKLGVEPTITHDTSRSVPRSLQLTLLDPAYIPGMANAPFPFNPFTNLLHASQVLRCGSYTVEISLGYFVMYWPRIQIRPGQRTFTWTGLDLTSLVASAPFLADYTIADGYAGGYQQAIADILHVDGTPRSLGGTGMTPTGNDDAGPAIPYALMGWMSATPNGYVPSMYANQAVTHDILQQQGQSRLDEVNKRWNEANCYPMFSDGAGVFQTKPKWTYGTAGAINTLPVGWDYSTVAASSIVTLDQGVLQELNSMADPNICNLAKVESAGTAAPANGVAATPLSSLQINNTPSSAVSYPNLRTLSGGPRVISKVVRQDGMNIQSVLDLYARVLVEQGATVTNVVTIETLPNGLHEHFDTLVAQVTDKTGSVLIPSSATATFIEMSHEMVLRGAGARHKHVLARVSPV